MGSPWTHISAAPTADDDGFVVAVDMKVGAYTLAATAAPSGARRVTCKRTVVTLTADTPGTIVLVGKDLAGQTITETLIPGADGVTVTSTKFFAVLSSATGAGWVIDGVEGDEDQIIIGWTAQMAVATGQGTLRGVVVNTTANGAITVADASGTIAVIKASVAEGFIGPYDLGWSGFLSVTPAAASDITVIHSGSLPSSYAI